MKPSTICLGDDIVQRIANTGKDQAFDFEPEVEVKCASNGVDFRLARNQSIFEAYKATKINAKINKQDIKICAYSKVPQKGFFAVNIEFYYMPGKYRTFYMGGEYTYRINDLNIDLLRSSFNNDSNVSSDEMYASIREKVVTPVVTEVVKKYLDEEIKGKFDNDQPLIEKDKETLNFILHENQGPLLEKAEAQLSKKAFDYFDGLLDVEIGGLKIVDNNNLRVED